MEEKQAPTGHPAECRCQACKGYRAYSMRIMRARYRTQIPSRHGVTAYSNYGCRCDVCSTAWSALMVKNRAARKARGPKLHGTANGNKDYLCHCIKCVGTRKMLRRQETAYAAASRDAESISARLKEGN